MRARRPPPSQGPALYCKTSDRGAAAVRPKTALSKDFEHPGWEPLRPAVRPERRMDRVARRRERIVGCFPRLVVEPDPHRRQHRGFGTNLDFIVVAGRMPILAVGLDDRKRNASLLH